jgi:hypothetical protein
MDATMEEPSGEAKRSEVGSKVVLERLGKKQSAGDFYVVVEQPEGDEAHGKAEKERAGDGVTESAARGESKEIFNVGREGAKDERRWNEARATKRERCCSVGERKGHIPIMKAGNRKPKGLRD